MLFRFGWIWDESVPFLSKEFGEFNTQHIAETDENRNERGNESGNENENGKGRFCGIGRQFCQ